MVKRAVVVSDVRQKNILTEAAEIFVSAPSEEFTYVGEYRLAESLRMSRSDFS